MADSICGVIALEHPARDNILPRRLGVLSLMMIIIAFNAPIAAMAGFIQLSIGYGSGIAAPLSFFIAGAILLSFSVGFVGMSRFMKDPGAFYQFIVAGMGRTPGLAGAFLATAAYLLLSAGSYAYMGVVSVDAATALTGRPLLSWQSWSMLSLAVLTIGGLFRIDLSMKLLGKLVCVEVALVAVWQLAVLARGGAEGYSVASFAPAGLGHGSLGIGILFAMSCMMGIEAGACFSAEARNPEMTVGRATYLSILFMAIFYSVGAWAYIISQGPSKVVAVALADPVGSFFASIRHYLGSVAVHLASLTLVTSQMAAITSIQGSASRYLFALGRDQVFPPLLSRVHQRFESPYVAVMAVGLFCFAILSTIFLFRIDPVTSYAALCGMSLYFLLPLLITTSFAIGLFYRRNSELPGNRWVRQIAPWLSGFALSALLILTSLNLKMLVGSQTAANISMLAVLIVPAAGLILAVFYRRHRPEIYQRIGNQ